MTAGFLAAVYLFAGLGKVARPYAALTTDPRMGWTNDFSPGTVKFIGAMEILAAIGLIVPPLVDAAPILTPIAAAGTFIIASGAVITHARRNEPQPLIANVVFALASAFVAVGRFWIDPF